MAKVYYRKIVNGEVNIETGAAWNLGDVPLRWREAVMKLLDDAT